MRMANSQLVVQLVTCSGARTRKPKTDIILGEMEEPSGLGDSIQLISDCTYSKLVRSVFNDTAWGPVEQ